MHTNREVTPEVVLPIGVSRVADACDRAGIPVAVADLAFVRDPTKTLLKAIGRHKPALIGLSVRNIDNADFRVPVYYLPAVAALVAAAREVTDVPIVAGGSGPSIAPLAVREALGVDTVVAGPGESAMLQLWGMASTGADLPPLIRGEEGTVHPIPHFEKWIDVGPYRRRSAPLNVQSRRGCPFGCIYCNYADIDGTARYGLNELSAVVHAIATATDRLGFRDVEFVDSTFNAPPQYTQQLCEALARADLGLSFQASGINPRFANRATLEAMKTAGFNAVMCSPDTASQELADRWGKGFQVDELATLAQDASTLNFPAMWSFMFGGPGETGETVAETLGFIRKNIDPDHPVMLTARMRIYPGTSLATTAAAEGYPLPQLDPNADGQFYMSSKVDPYWLDERLLALQQECPNVMFMDGSQSKALPWIHRARALLGQRGPAWTTYARTRRRLKRVGSIRGRGR